MNKLIFGISFDYNASDYFEPVYIKGLSDIPFFGTAFFSHMSVVYIALALVPVISFFLKKTEIGLNLRAVGENPKVADTLGVDVYRYQYATSIIGCGLMGTGGAFLSTGLLHFFSEDMVSGRGYIAIAAVIFGRYTPLGVLVASLTFMAGNVVANILQTTNEAIPYNFLVMIPYLLTILVLMLFAGKTRAPMSLGKVYYKG